MSSDCFDPSGNAGGPVSLYVVNGDDAEAALGGGRTNTRPEAGVGTDG